MEPARPLPARPLPPPRERGRYRIGLVCLGNICRSPMAEVVLRAHVGQAGLAAYVAVDSCGTGGWHVGNPMDPRAAATLRSAGHDPDRHRAQQWAPSWLADHDLLLAMDAQNLTDLGGPSARVRLFRDHDPLGRGGDVPDPYYGGDSGFEEVLEMVERTCAALVADLPRALGQDLPEPDSP